MTSAPRATLRGDGSAFAIDPGSCRSGDGSRAYEAPARDGVRHRATVAARSASSEPPSGVRTTLHAPHGTLENPGRYLTERVRATRWRVEAATEPEARNGHHGDAAPVPVPEELVLGALLEDLRRGG